MMAPTDRGLLQSLRALRVAGPLFLGLLGGCVGSTPYRLPPSPAPPSRPDAIARTSTPNAARPAVAALPMNSPVELVPVQHVVVDLSKELSVDALIQQVLARNPSLAEMHAAWVAATAKYPQAISLEDPMFGATVAPGSVASPAVTYGWRVEASQKLPWPGKRDLRGQVAAAEAHAAGHDVDDIRVQLIETARHAFYEYYLVDRALAVNVDALRSLQEFRGNAESRFKANLVPQQDLTQADVEIGKQRERQLLLERMRAVAVARINTLQNLPANDPLPPPPKELAPPAALPSIEQLQAAALANRPDLQALANRVAAEQANVALATKEFRPDFEVMAAYDAFWQAPQQTLAPQIGVRMNLPVRRSKRCAALAEAEARLAQRTAELEKQQNQIRFQVQEAYAQLRESEQVVLLYTRTILPAAENNVKAAQTAYATSKVPFLSLIDAQRNFIDLRTRYYETLADQYRRRATLERVVGGALQH